MQDETIREGLEQLSTQISRRKFVEKAIKSIFATLAAVAAGEIDSKVAYASYYCCATSAVACVGCPSVTGSLPGCPSGFTKCTSSRCCGGTTCNGTTYYCYWSSGAWSCFIGSTEYLCTDCYKTNCKNPGNSTNGPCTCAWKVR